MPLEAGMTQYAVSRNIKELHGGKTYRRTLLKSGKRKADKQAIAIALAKKRETILKGKRR